MISTAVSIFAIRCARQAHVNLLALFLSIWSVAGTGPVLGQETRKLAFIVGVSTYQKDGLANLQFAAKDATDLAEELRRQGFKVVILTGSDATKKAVEQKLQPTVQGCAVHQPNSSWRGFSGLSYLPKSHRAQST